jgi:hypothetical protein
MTSEFKAAAEAGREREQGATAPAQHRMRVRWAPWSWPLSWIGRESRHTLFRAGDQLASIAEKSWEISPACTSVSRPAIFLPDQLERVTGMAYTDNPLRDMQGGVETREVPTRGFLLRDVWILGRSLYRRPLRFDLYAARRRLPTLRVDTELDRGAIYCTYEANEFFGLWLTDDCPTYDLARNEGVPVTTDLPVSAHMQQYERWLGMAPMRLGRAFLREAVLFDDWGQTPSRRARFRALREKLRSHVSIEPHPGVFILRRASGKRRIMHNELEMAEHLRARRGFRIVDVTVDDVPRIVAACAGARIIAGVEGSHMVHGLCVMPRGACVLALQPPDRFCGVLKWTTDRHDQDYSFVVGHAQPGGFRVDPAEVERTLDLISRN